MSNNAAVILFHEVDQDQRHRILIRKGPGEMVSGEWAQAHEMAELSGYYHAGTAQNLPPGIFRLQMKGYEMLCSHAAS